MSRTSLFLLQLARWIAGRDRREWADAMEAEALLSESHSTGWAAGCLFASARDRLAREWPFVAAVLLFPICSFLLSLALFFPLSWLWLNHLIPGWISVGSALFAPLPFAILLGRIYPGRRAYSAVPISFVIAMTTPLMVFWWKFGKSPFSWFGHDSTLYMMTPAAGLTCGFLVWLLGAWIGSHMSRRHISG